MIVDLLIPSALLYFPIISIDGFDLTPLSISVIYDTEIQDLSESSLIDRSLAILSNRKTLHMLFSLVTCCTS